MLGHLVSTGHAAASDPAPQHLAAPSQPRPSKERQPGWLERLFAQFFQRR